MRSDRSGDLQGLSLALKRIDRPGTFCVQGSTPAVLPGPVCTKKHGAVSGEVEDVPRGSEASGDAAGDPGEAADEGVMMEDAGLLTDILEDPEDDAPRLVYADWLDEHASDESGHARAEFIRVQIELARLP